MGIVSRPGSPYVQGATIDPSDANVKEQTLYDEFNGNIDDANIKASAAIKGTKLADAPNGIPTSKYNDLSVTGAKIAYDSAVDGNRAIGPDHIKDASVKRRQVKTSVYTWALPNGALTPGQYIYQDSALLLATMKILGAYLEGVDIGGGTQTAWFGYGIFRRNTDDHVFLYLWNHDPTFNRNPVNLNLNLVYIPDV